MGALGRHVLVEYYDCDPQLLDDVVYIEKSMEMAALKANATLINSAFHHFSPFGVSGVIVIQESHFAIHTWPEYGFASVDLFTCGESVDPWVSFGLLKQSLKASHESAMEMKRGELRLLSKKAMDIKQMRETKMVDLQIPKRTRDIWFTERNETTALSLKHDGQKLFEKITPFQKVEVYNTLEYGNMLALDGMVMCTEKDEYVYHEMITHVPMLLHPDPQKILVIGGGDGGTAREILKHQGVDSIELVEIDNAVVEASKLHLPTISPAFGHSKLQLKIEDGIKFVKNVSDESFDLVIVDSTDPVGPGEGLFTKDFYLDVYRILTKQGIMVTQSESPRFNQSVFKEIYQCYRDIFGLHQVHCYLAYIPTFPTGMWSFSFCSKGNIHPINDLDQDRVTKFIDENQLSYYNLDVHRAAFALPNFVAQLIEVQVTA
ncbi:MAG: polyamine aminopropyltransferase [Bacteroidetes bacterium]|nr:polyamine aminopropyltransferase [Bacteroidota bacterium]